MNRIKNKKNNICVKTAKTYDYSIKIGTEDNISWWMNYYNIPFDKFINDTTSINF